MIYPEPCPQLDWRYPSLSIRPMPNLNKARHLGESAALRAREGIMTC